MLIFFSRNLKKTMRHNIRFIIIIIIILTIIPALVYPNKKLFSWGLFKLFVDSPFRTEGLRKAQNFDPDKDILYLPSLKDKDIFQAVGDLSITRKECVRKYLYWYLTGGREYLIRSIERSYRYEDIIKNVFNKNKDIPEELSLLPLLESSFDPHAISGSRAAGLWQFVHNTAKPLGLLRNRWVDERRNVEKSTEAAVAHLRNLRGIFPSWELVLAAYNGGAGYIQRAMARSGAKDLWTLNRSGLLRNETREYVPRFIALLLIYQNRRLFGIKDEISIPEKRDDEYVTLEKPVDLRAVAKLAGVPLNTIKELNPELNLDFTPVYKKRYRLLLPAHGKKRLEENRKELYKHGIRGVIEYRIKKGDTIGKIARLHRSNAVLIMELNHIRNPKALFPGQIILMPY